jgi:hypothetical protein
MQGTSACVTRKDVSPHVLVDAVWYYCQTIFDGFFFATFFSVILVNHVHLAVGSTSDWLRIGLGAPLWVSSEVFQWSPWPALGTTGAANRSQPSGV